MIIEYISQKNNFMTCSEYSDAPEALFENVFRTRPDMGWKIGKVRPWAWIKLNSLTTVPLKEVYYDYVGTCAGIKCYVSHNDINWTQLNPYGDPRDPEYTGIDFIFFKLEVEQPNEDFELIDFRVSGDIDLDISRRWISVVADNYFPQAFFEKNVMVPAFVTDFLRMLEDGEDNLIADIPADFNLDFRIVIRDELIGGAINAAPINSVAINGMVYKSDGSNTIDFYIEPNPESEWKDAIYVWNFDDPFSTPENPNFVLKKDAIGYTSHSFNHLGNYYVSLIGRMPNGKTVEVVKLLEFTTTGDIIPPDLTVNEPDSETYDPNFTFTGTTEPNASVKASLRNSDTYGTVNEDGTWFLTVPELEMGLNAIIFTATDDAGNTTSISRVVTRKDPLELFTMDPVPTEITDTHFLFSGSVGPNTTVLVDLVNTSGTVTYIPTVADGMWSLDLSIPLGQNTVIAKGTYGATGITKEISAPIKRLTVPFTFSVDPIASPTYSKAIVLSGKIALDGTVTGSADTIGALPPATYSDNGDGTMMWTIEVTNLAEGLNNFTFAGTYLTNTAYLNAAVTYEKQLFSFIVKLPNASYVPRIIPMGNDFLATTYHSTGSAIWRVSSGGVSWNKITSFYPEVDAQGLVALSSSVVLVGTSNNGTIFRSPNGASSFDTGRRLGTEVHIGCICRINDSVVVAGSGNSGQIWKSMDGGRTWTLKQRLGTEVYIHDIISLESGIMFAGTANGGQVWVSVDDGETWRLSADLGSEFRVKCFTEVAPGIVLAGTYPNGQIWKTSDYGNNWVLIGQLGSEQHVNTLCSDGNGMAYAGTGNHAQIWQTVDRGDTWSLYQSIPSETIVYSIALNNGVAVAGTYPSALIYKL